MRRVEHVACTRERRDTYRVMVGKLEGKKPLGRHKSRWEDNIKMIFRKWDKEHELDWSGL